MLLHVHDLLILQEADEASGVLTRVVHLDGRIDRRHTVVPRDILSTREQSGHQLVLAGELDVHGAVTNPAGALLHDALLELVDHPHSLLRCADFDECIHGLAGVTVHDDVNGMEAGTSRLEADLGVLTEEGVHLSARSSVWDVENLHHTSSRRDRVAASLDEREVLECLLDGWWSWSCALLVGGTFEPSRECDFAGAKEGLRVAVIILRNLRSVDFRYDSLGGAGSTCSAASRRVLRREWEWARHSSRLLAWARIAVIWVVGVVGVTLLDALGQVLGARLGHARIATHGSRLSDRGWNIVVHARSSRSRRVVDEIAVAGTRGERSTSHACAARVLRTLRSAHRVVGVVRSHVGGELRRAVRVVAHWGLRGERVGGDVRHAGLRAHDIRTVAKVRRNVARSAGGVHGWLTRILSARSCLRLSGAVIERHADVALTGHVADSARGVADNSGGNVDDVAELDGLQELKKGQQNLFVMKMCHFRG